MKIEKLRAERLKYDKLLHWENDKIKIKEVLQHLRYIKDYIDSEGSVNSFIKEDSFNLTEEESRRKVAAMNVMREHINANLINRE